VKTSADSAAVFGRMEPKLQKINIYRLIFASLFANFAAEKMTCLSTTTIISNKR